MSLNIPKLIDKKRDREELSDEEIAFFVKSVVSKSMQDSQLGAFLMAAYLNGLSSKETVTLTKEMMNSGLVMSWPSSYRGLTVDKHSTGGVGDKVSLPLAPALAAWGLKVPMISGRGLGHTGGTLDKLDSIPGFRTSVTMEEAQRTLDDVGCFIIGQTADIVPADGIIYATRDVTSTVSSIPLITASIISKKAAESLDVLVLDIKCGRAAFLKSREDARCLAESLVSVSKGLGINTLGVLTKMDAPIGKTIGNSLEIKETIECLQGKGPADLWELVTLFGGHVLKMSGKATSFENGVEMIEEVLKNGRALDVFRRMMVAQGVSSETADKLCSEGGWSQAIPQAKSVYEVKAAESGYIQDIDSLGLAIEARDLGAGRCRSTDVLDYSAGFELIHSIGDRVEKGTTWAVIHHNKESLDLAIDERLRKAIQIAPESVDPDKLKRFIELCV